MARFNTRALLQGKRLVTVASFNGNQAAREFRVLLTVFSWVAENSCCSLRRGIRWFETKPAARRQRLRMYSWTQVVSHCVVPEDTLQGSLVAPWNKTQFVVVARFEQHSNYLLVISRHFFFQLETTRFAHHLNGARREIVHVSKVEKFRRGSVWSPDVGALDI